MSQDIGCSHIFWRRWRRTKRALKEGGVDEHAETKESLHSQSGEKQRELIAVGRRFRKCLKGPIIDLFGTRYFSFLGYAPGFVDPLCQGISQTGGQPALILPALYKIFHHQTYFGYEWKLFWDYIWTLGRAAVRSADKIIIIGYSMPQADQRARELLWKESNPRAEVRVFSGTRTEYIYEEFRKQGFRNTGSNNSGYFEDYLDRGFVD